MWLFGGKKKQFLLEWQNSLLVEPESRLIMTEKQLKEQTQIRVQNDLRIISDSTALIESTTKPDVFFSRLQLLEEKAVDLVQFEKYIALEGAKPADALEELRNNKQEAVSRFLFRYFSTVLDKVDSLKTNKAKLNQFTKFYESMQPFFSMMDEKNIDYVETKYKAYTRAIEKGQE